MDKMTHWLKQKADSEKRHAGFPWWAWALVLAGGLSVLVSWLLRRRQPTAQIAPAEAMPSFRIHIAETSLENIAPAIQEIPLPAQPSSRSSRQIADAPLPSTRTAPAAKTTSTDDLTKIEGIGVKISALLRDAGIRSFAQLAETPVEQLQKILHEANIRIGDPTTWPEQAELAAKGDWNGLRILQNQLKGGRRIP